jgi:hypothetical protein
MSSSTDLRRIFREKNAIERLNFRRRMSLVSGLTWRRTSDILNCCVNLFLLKTVKYG